MACVSLRDALLRVASDGLEPIALHHGFKLCFHRTPQLSTHQHAAHATLCNHSCRVSTGVDELVQRTEYRVQATGEEPAASPGCATDICVASPQSRACVPRVILGVSRGGQLWFI